MSAPKPVASGDATSNPPPRPSPRGGGGGGRIIFVAAPPGGKDSLSLRAHDALASCELLVHDAGVDPELLALAPAHARREALEAGASINDTAAESVAGGSRLCRDRLVTGARAGLRVVRLTEKAPLFGEFPAQDEEIARVASAAVPFEIVPSLLPETAVASFGGVALGASYAVLRAREGEELAHRDWASLAHATDSLVVLATRATLDSVVTALLEHGRSPDTPAMVLTDLGRPSQRTEQGVLSDIATRARRLVAVVDHDRILVVGEAVAQRAALRWFDRRPLFGKRVLVTRTAEQSRAMLDLLRARGADAIAVPTISIHPPPDPAPMQAALGQLGARTGCKSVAAEPRTSGAGDYDFVVFTSENGVACAWDEIVRQGKDARAFGSVYIAAIGPGTARALVRHGLSPDIVAKEFRGEGLAQELISSPLAAEVRARRGTGPRVLIARALVARDALPEALRAAGFHVEVVALYETRAPGPENAANLARALEDGAIDAVTFTSKSTVDNLCAMLGGAPDIEVPRLLAKTKVAAIGPITREAAEAHGIRVDVTASPFTVEALVSALEANFAGAYS